MKRDTSLYVLDISNVTDNFATKWQEITDAVNANLASTEARGRAQVAVPSDGKNLLISGGFPYTNHSTTPQHLVYNTESNTWRSLAEFDDGPNGKYRQMYDTYWWSTTLIKYTTVATLQRPHTFQKNRNTTFTVVWKTTPSILGILIHWQMQTSQIQSLHLTLLDQKLDITEWRRSILAVEQLL